MGLAASERFYAAFQFDGIPPKAFNAFFLPDVLLVAMLSVVRGYRRSVGLEYVILGAFGYAALYCLNATILTGSGALPTTLMLLGLAFNGFLVFGNQSFRSSTSPSVVVNGVKTMVQIVCVWFITLVVFPYLLLTAFGELTWPPPAGRLIVAIGVFALSSALGLSAAWVMVRDGEGTPLPLDQTNRLVIVGPYRYVRNPMAVAGVGQGLSVALAFGSWAVMVYALLGGLLWQLVVRPLEEANLEERFGEDYRRYRERVRCWWPGK